MGGLERRHQLFLRPADVLAARTDEAIAIMASAVGAARPWAAFNVALALEILREAAAAITAPTDQVVATDTPGAYPTAVRVPFGVVDAISPWEAPFILGMRWIAVLPGADVFKDKPASNVV